MGSASHCAEVHFAAPAPGFSAGSANLLFLLSVVAWSSTSRPDASGEEGPPSERFLLRTPLLLCDSSSPETTVPSVEPDSERIKGLQGLLTDQEKTQDNALELCRAAFQAERLMALPRPSGPMGRTAAVTEGPGGRTCSVTYPLSSQ